jgi:transcriptional regulator with GAF, ATPase, and Fis domain
VGRSSPELVEEIGRLIVEQQPEHYRWPGNIRELEQCVRRILLNGVYDWQQTDDSSHGELAESIEQGTLTANQLLGDYCSGLYAKLGSYEAVGRVTQLDRRTVKKYIVDSG